MFRCACCDLLEKFLSEYDSMQKYIFLNNPMLGVRFMQLLTDKGLALQLNQDLVIKLLMEIVDNLKYYSPTLKEDFAEIFEEVTYEALLDYKIIKQPLLKIFSTTGSALEIKRSLGWSTIAICKIMRVLCWFWQKANKTLLSEDEFTQILNGLLAEVLTMQIKELTPENLKAIFGFIISFEKLIKMQEDYILL